MKISRVEENDFEEILKLILQEFPYLSMNKEKILEKISSKKINVLKAVENGELAGFVELEKLGPGEARLNALAIKQEFRGKEIGKKLLEKIIELAGKKEIRRITLLVKEDNEKAKQLYRIAGFDFVGIYEKEISNSPVEEMELLLEKKEPVGVS